MLAINVVTATFMVGLALGSFLLNRIANRCQNLLKLYASLELGIAAGAVLCGGQFLVVVLSLLITVDLSRTPLLMNSGVYYYTHCYQAMGGLRQALAENPRLIEQIEGLETTVAAFEDRDGSRFF